jgi:hypothetical protein
MANPTMTLIASNTVGSGGAGTVVFSSIPSTYTDLAIKVSAANSAMWLKFNTDTTTGNYSAKVLRGDSAYGVSSVTNAIWGYYIFSGYSGATSVFSSFDIYIPNYASSNQKSVSIDSVAEGNSADEWSTLIAGLWNQTSAINQITFDGGGGTFAQYSTFYLYGINNS